MKEFRRLIDKWAEAITPHVMRWSYNQLEMGYWSFMVLNLLIIFGMAYFFMWQPLWQWLALACWGFIGFLFSRVYMTVLFLLSNQRHDLKFFRDLASDTWMRLPVIKLHRQLLYGKYLLWTGEFDKAHEMFSLIYLKARTFISHPLFWFELDWLNFQIDLFKQDLKPIEWNLDRIRNLEIFADDQEVVQELRDVYLQHIQAAYDICYLQKPNDYFETVVPNAESQRLFKNYFCGLNAILKNQSETGKKILGQLAQEDTGYYIVRHARYILKEPVLARQPDKPLHRVRLRHIAMTLLMLLIPLGLFVNRHANLGAYYHEPLTSPASITIKDEAKTYFLTVQDAQNHKGSLDETVKLIVSGKQIYYSKDGIEEKLSVDDQHSILTLDGIDYYYSIMKGNLILRSKDAKAKHQSLEFISEDNFLFDAFKEGEVEYN